MIDLDQMRTRAVKSRDVFEIRDYIEARLMEHDAELLAEPNQPRLGGELLDPVTVRGIMEGSVGFGLNPRSEQPIRRLAILRICHGDGATTKQLVSSLKVNGFKASRSAIYDDVAVLRASGALGSRQDTWWGVKYFDNRMNQ